MFRCICCGKEFLGPQPKNPADLDKCPECRAKNRNLRPPDPQKAAKRAAEERRKKEAERRKREEEKKRRKKLLTEFRLSRIKQRKEELEKTFAELKNIIPNYIQREPQLKMAFGIREAIANKQIIVAEAGVGTGKTFAYLIPIFMEKQKFVGPVIISTKTINLQEQLTRDIDNIKRLFRDEKTIVVLSKGKTNYCCRQRFEALYEKLKEPRNRQEMALKEILDKVGIWLNKRGFDFGDESAPYISDNLKEELSVGKCNRSCKYWNSGCDYSRMKRTRESIAEIIITNHNQLINDLRNRAASKKGLWWSPSLIVFDEAHALEDIARSELGVAVSTRSVRKQLNKVRASSVISGYAYDLEESYKALSRVESILRNWVDKRKGLFDDSYSNKLRYPIEIDSQLIDSIEHLNTVIEYLKDEIDIAYASISRTSKKYSSVEELADRFEDLYNTLKQINLMLKNKTGYVFWIEKSNKQHGYSLVAAPLDPSSFLKNNLWNKNIPVVLTSGTLTVNDSFTHFQDRLGLQGKNIITQQHKSPFDYEHNVLIYAPRDLPEPPQHPVSNEDDEFTSAIAIRCKELLSISKGRALILFTSYRRLHKVYDYLMKQSLEYRILKQGDAGPGNILKKFREDISSVLLATGAFWEGTDVAGEALSLLVIDKLPFPNYSDPLYQSLIKRAKEQGFSPYEKITLPTMLTTLHQGSGRLIRQESDRGVIALLDKRAWRENLYTLVTKHLPPARLTDELASVAKWFRSVVGAGL